MRAGGTLTVAVLMRAVLSGDRAFFIQALAEISGLSERRAAAFARAPAGPGFAAVYRKARLPAAFLPAFRAALAGAEAMGLSRGETLSRALTERVIGACEASGDPELAPLLSLLWRLAAEAARADARDFAADAARVARPSLFAPRLEAPNYAPLLIEAVAAALEEFDAPPLQAPPVEATAQLESSLAPPIELTLADFNDELGTAPPLQLPADMLAALGEAA